MAFVQPMSILFVTGTDTGIGKTFVSCLIANELKRRGLCIGVMKPVETGCERLESGELYAYDASLLWKASSRVQSIGEVAPYVFSMPAAPVVAAESEGEIIEPQILIDAVFAASKKCNVLIVEGAGGVLVPITYEFSYTDLAKAIGASVLVVVGSRLGAINHALCTFEVLKSRSIDVCGYVLNDLFATDTVATKNPAILHNRSTLSRIASTYEIEEVGYVPYIANVREQDMSQCVVPYLTIKLNKQKFYLST